MGRQAFKGSECVPSRNRGTIAARPAVWTFLLAATLLTFGCEGVEEDPFALRSGDGSSDPFGGLGEEIEFEGYRIRPPKNIPRREMPTPAPSIKIAAWTEGHPKSNRPSSGVILVCVPNPTDLTTTPPDWARGASNSLSAFGKMFKDVKQIAGSRMQVNGLEAYRSEFMGKTANEELVAGIILILIDNKNVMACVAVGVGKNAGDATGSLEKSLMTISKPGYDPPENVLWDAPPGATPGVRLTKTHLDMIKTHGLDKIAVITVEGIPFTQEDHVEKAFREAAGPGSLCMAKSRAPNHLLLVAPVEDMAKFAEKIDLGHISAVDEENRSFTLQIEEGKIPTVQDEHRAKIDKMTENLPRGFSETPAVTDPNDPEFFEQNLKALQNGNRFDRKKVLRRLVEADTSKLNDPETHKAIAKAIREVAFDGSATPDERRIAIRGLVHWGGKYAGPVLAQLLRENSTFVEDEICEQLAILKEPSAIDALVEKLMEPGMNSEKVAKCLVAYGPMAEDSILANTRAENMMTTRLIVQVLAEIGTKKSLPALKSLRNVSFATMIAGDLQRAVRMIEQREKGR